MDPIGRNTKIRTKKKSLNPASNRGVDVLGAHFDTENAFFYGVSEEAAKRAQEQSQNKLIEKLRDVPYPLADMYYLFYGHNVSLPQIAQRFLGNDDEHAINEVTASIRDIGNLLMYTETWSRNPKVPKYTPEQISNLLGTYQDILDPADVTIDVLVDYYINQKPLPIIGYMLGIKTAVIFKMIMSAHQAFELLEQKLPKELINKNLGVLSPLCIEEARHLIFITQSTKVEPPNNIERN